MIASMFRVNKGQYYLCFHLHRMLVFLKISFSPLKVKGFGELSTIHDATMLSSTSCTQEPCHRWVTASAESALSEWQRHNLSKGTNLEPVSTWKKPDGSPSLWSEQSNAFSVFIWPPSGGGAEIVLSLVTKQGILENVLSKWKHKRGKNCPVTCGR